MQSQSGKADPAIYPKLREHAFTMRPAPGASPGTISVVLMDWHVTNGTATVLAASDGSASLYLSSGGGFIGGGQKYPAIHQAALHAIDLARTARPHFRTADSTGLPPAGKVRFFLITAGPAQFADADDADLRNGSSPLLDLGNAMQAIVTGYRLMMQSQPPA